MARSFRDCGFYGFQKERTSDSVKTSVENKIRNLPETVTHKPNNSSPEFYDESLEYRENEDHKYTNGTKMIIDIINLISLGCLTLIEIVCLYGDLRIYASTCSLKTRDQLIKFINEQSISDGQKRLLIEAVEQ